MQPVFKTGKGDKNAYYDVDILAIDVSWVAKRHQHALGQRFFTSDKRMSGHVYGAFKDIAALTAAIRPQKVAFCYDRGYQWRVNIVSSYKESRRAPDKKDKWSPAPDVERLFRNFPGYHLSVDGFEADDMAGYLALSEEVERDGALVIYSKDRDLWQLVHDGNEIACVMPGKKASPRARTNRMWIREEQVRDEFGVGPGHVAKLKALLGDPSDNIKGLLAKKPGKKDLLRAFVQTLSSDDFFDPIIESPELEADEWLTEALMKERDRLCANYEITSIKKAVARIDSCPLQEREEPNLAGALDVLAEFECDALMARVDPLFSKLRRR